MSAFGLWVGMAAIAAVVTRLVARHVASAPPLRRGNYRGLQVPTAAGVSIVVGVLAAVAAGRLLSFIDPDSVRLLQLTAAARPVLAILLGFAMLGLWDDLAGTSEERGWASHVRALRDGRATAGALKLAAGGALALVVAPGPGFGWTVVNAATIALSANLFNLLDLRPGRASKVGLIAAVALIAATGPLSAHLAAATGAIAAFLPLDLRERAMLGDTGANAIGALIGLAIVATGSHTWVLIALAVLIALNVAGQRPGLSALIDATPPLRSFDRAGRAPHRVT